MKVILAKLKVVGFLRVMVLLKRVGESSSLPQIADTIIDMKGML